MRMYRVWRFGVHSLGLGFQVRGVGVFRVSGSGLGVVARESKSIRVFL